MINSPGNKETLRIIPVSSNTLRWKFAQAHPTLTFLLLCFAWSWTIWLAAIPLANDDALLRYALTLVGGFGPAVGGILASGLKQGLRFNFSARRLVIAGITSALIFALMAARYALGNFPGFETLPGTLRLTPAILLCAVAASLIGGWVVSNARSANPDIRARLASLLPRGTSLGWLLFALLFYPALILLSWAAASAVGLPVEYPGLWGRPAAEVIPLFLLSFSLTALARGGNEEPGWRGVMQPELQKKISPLVASLIIAFFWSLWHLPLFLNGFYAGDVVSGMLGGGVYRIFLSIFLTWVYNRSRGNVLLMVLLHASFNVAVDYLPLSDTLLAVFWLVISVGLVIKGKMAQKLPATA